MTATRMPRRGSEEPLVGLDVGKLRKVKGRDLLVRFAFGAGVSIGAGLIGMVAGARVGGMFLAFPAILPATLTLIEQKEGNDKAAQDVAGAILGAAGLVAFAVTAAFTLGRFPAVPALLLATAAWLVVSVAVYLVVEPILRRRQRRAG